MIIKNPKSPEWLQLENDIKALEDNVNSQLLQIKEKYENVTIIIDTKDTPIKPPVGKMFGLCLIIDVGTISRDNLVSTNLSQTS